MMEDLNKYEKTWLYMEYETRKEEFDLNKFMIKYYQGRMGN